MTSTEISAEAREILASAYIAAGKPWFAVVIRDTRLHQFDVCLSVLTEQLQPKKYCRYDLPTPYAMIDFECECEWCKQ